MGRFYQTAEPTFVDNKMFEAPHELMAQVLMGKDKAIDTEISNAASLYDKLTADVLKQDTPRAREIIQGYEQQVNDIVSNIQKNPLEYNKYSNTIRELGRGINKDWTMGEIGTMQGYKKQVTDEWNKLDELAKKDPKTYDAAYVAAEKDAILKEYRGINWNKETGRAGAAPSVQSSYHGLNFDLDDYLKQKMEADGYTRERDSTGNGYIYRNKTSNEVLSPQKVAEATVAYFNANPDIQSAVQRRGELGIEGFVGADVDNALKYDRQGNLIGYGDNYYGRMAEASARHKAFSKTEQSDTIHADSTAMTKMGWARDDKAKEEEKAREVGLATTSLYDNKLYDAKNYVDDLNTTNVNLKATTNRLTNLANLYLKSNPNNKAIYNAILRGDVNAMKAARINGGKQELLDPATAEIIGQEYQNLRVKKNVLDRNMSSFKEYLVKSGNKGDATKVGTLGWSKNPDLMNKYNDYVTKKGIYGNPFTQAEREVSFAGIDINEGTKKKLAKLTEENILNMQITPQNTASGQETIYEDANGNQVVYVNTASNIKAGTRQKLPNGKEKIYLKADKYSMEDLTKRGLARIVTDVDKETGETKTQIVTRKNGKDVGFVLNPTSFGIVHGVDRNGEINFGMKAQSGGNFIDLEMPISQYRLDERTENSIRQNEPIWKDEALTKSLHWDIYGRDRVNVDGIGEFIIDNDKVYYGGDVVSDKELIQYIRLKSLKGQK